MKIPIIVVDDDSTDRYIVRRRLSRSAVFGEILEASTGAEFLTEYFDEAPIETSADTPLLVLMDINMPRMNGFETIAELDRRRSDGKGPKKVDVFMYSSSESEEDQFRADSMPLVKGYIVKPFDEEDISRIEHYYSAS